VNLRPLHVLGSIGQVRKSLLAAAVALPWTAEEFLGTKAIEALGVGLGVGLLLARGDFDTGATIVIALAAGLAYLRFSVGRLQTTARRRLQRFKQRLPFGIDLVALMMAAGSGFRESLATLVHESQQHPVGDEFGKLLRGLERGQSLRESLGHLQERLQDPDVKEMVFAVQKAEELGTPLSRVFFSMAEQMRLKRSQWLEKAAGKAQTMITFPGLLIMVACLLLVTAPFVIDAVQNSQF
jgi:tight adherence protein C